MQFSGEWTRLDKDPLGDVELLYVGIEAERFLGIEAAFSTEEPFGQCVDLTSK